MFCFVSFSLSCFGHVDPTPKLDKTQATLSLPCVQDMYARLLSANLDFDPELQHVFCWAPGECRDSRVFHVDRVFSPSLLNVVLASGLGVSNVTRGWQFLTRTHVFQGHGMFSSGSCGNTRVLGISAVVINSVGIW